MIKELVNKISSANQAYRLGKPVMSDSQYDILVDELKSLDPHNPILDQVGHKVADESRKRKLPIEMASMNKVKTIDEIKDWVRLKGIDQNEEVIITPKFDGLSLCVDESSNEATTRGDGEIGQRSDEHYTFIQNHLTLKHNPFKYTYGEVMMPKQVFIDKYSADFANPRNLVAGLLNSKTVDESLKSTLNDCYYIKYGAIEPKNLGPKLKTKQEIINQLNVGQKEKVNYHICQIKDLTEDLLISLFHKLSPNYEIDGVIIEINDLNLQEKLGRENSTGNPVWARAFKHESFEQVAETTITGISWNISKQGLLKPTLHIKPVRLDGVTVSNVTGNNARFVKDLGLGVGAKVLIKRSGMVIPIIYDVIEKVDFQMPNVPNIDWNENGVELITLDETDEQRFKQTVSFFEILEVDNVGEGVVKQLWEAGYNSIKSILELTPDKLSKIEGFGKRKSMIVYNSIQSKVKDVELSKLQHATGFFKGLGSKKLALLEHFDCKPTIDQVMEIDGFAQTSAQSYIDSYEKFFNFIKDLPISIQKKKEVMVTSDSLSGTTFVFTGIRMKQEEAILESFGAKIGSSVSKNTTHLVCKDPNSESSKLEKAKTLGIKIISVDELLEMLKDLS